jgi:hypothetical protein
VGLKQKPSRKNLEGLLFISKAMLITFLIALAQLLKHY